MILSPDYLGVKYEMNVLLIVAIGLVALIIGMILTAVFANTKIKGPNAKQEMNKYYREDDECYRFKIKQVSCSRKKLLV